MKAKWIRRLDVAVALTVVGLVALAFALMEYNFRVGWKKTPPAGSCRVVCRLWNVDRHLFHNISSPFRFPSGYDCSSYGFTHMSGRRGLIKGTTTEPDESDPYAVLREYLREETAYYRRARPDGKPPVRFEAYIITSDGKIHAPAPEPPRAGG